MTLQISVVISEATIRLCQLILTFLQFDSFNAECYTMFYKTKQTQ